MKFWIYISKGQFCVLCLIQISGMLASIITIGEAIGLYAEACLFVDSLRARLRRVAAAVASKTRPRVLLLQGIDPLLLGGHWVYEMETFAGGFDGLQKPGCPPERLHWQRLTAYAPEVLILAPLSSGLDRCLAEVCFLNTLFDQSMYLSILAGYHPC